MTKSKVGAEPKSKIKHSFTKDAGIHEGIHRDEPGWYDGKLHCYCFGYGYFFHRGKPLGTKLTPDYIKDFAKYYNLQDKLSFPLDKTTTECMENHLIHLPSGKTIEAVGTMDI